MATNKTVTVEAKTKGFDEAEKEIQDVGKAAKVANDSVEGLNKTFEQTYGEIQPLTTRMGEAEDRLYELAAAGDTTSREYQGLLEKVGNYRKVQIETDLAVDQAAKTLSQKLGTALTGAASGFTAATGVIGLMGTESKELEKLLLKVNAAMAFQQGVEGIREYTKSVGLASKVTKVFNLIVAGNPLAIFLTIVTSIVASVLAFTDVLDQIIQSFKDLGDAIGLTHFAENELAEERKKRNFAQMQRQKAEQTLRDAEIKQLEALGKSTIALRRQQVVANIAAIKQQKEFNDLFSEGQNAIRRALGQEEIKVKQSEASIRRQAQIIDLETQLIELDKEQEAVNKSNSEKAAKRRKEKLEDLEEERRLTQEIIDQEIDEEIALQQTFDDIQRENEDRLRTEQQNELLLVEEKYDALKASAFGNAEALEQIEIARLNERNDINLKYDQEAYDAKKALEDKAAEDTKKLIEDERQARFEGIQKGLEYAQQGADAIQQLGDLVFANKMSKLEEGSKEEEEFARKQFKFNKALQLSGAVIDAAKAINSSLAQSPIAIGPVPNPAGIASLAFAATTGALNIAKIASAKFESTSTDVDTPSPNVGGGAPSFNVVGDSNVNQLAELQQQPAQAYVVSGEVTTAQALDRNRVQNATL